MLRKALDLAACQRIDICPTFLSKVPDKKRSGAIIDRLKYEHLYVILLW